MSRRRSLILLTILYVAGVAICLVATDDWTGRQTLVIALSGAVVLWYTWETQQLRLAAARQTELLVQPFVVAHPSGAKVQLSNVGQAAALNVHLPDIAVATESENWKITIACPERVPVLRAGESATLDLKTFVNAKEMGDFFAPHLDPKYATTRIELTIEYQSVQLQRYSVIQVIEPQKLSISEFKRGAGV